MTKSSRCYIKDIIGKTGSRSEASGKYQINYKLPNFKTLMFKNSLRIDLSSLKHKFVICDLELGA